MVSSPRAEEERLTHVDPELEEFARSVVARQLGGREVTRVDALQVGVDHAVLRLTMDSSPPVVLKVSGPADQRPIDFERTATVTALAGDAGVPVPTVLAVDSSFRAGPWRYLLLEYADGTEWRRVRPLLDDRELRAVHRQIAEALLTIQSVHLDSFGEVESGEIESAEGAGNGPARRDLLSALRQRAEHLITDERERRSFAELLDRRASLFVAPDQSPTLTHDDLHHGNVIFRADRGRWELTGVLDWDKAWAGPAESDVARMAFWDDMTGPGFWEVYRAAVPVVDGWVERRMIYQLLWCLEYDSSSPRHRLDTARLRQQLGVV